MFQLDSKDHRPLYEQIKDKMKTLVIHGVLTANERIPSVRELAQSLTLNPNTIQKAYKDLEAEGFIYSVPGKGSFITPLEPSENQGRKDELLQKLEKLAAELMYLNVPKERVIASIQDIYRKKEVGSRD